MKLPSVEEARARLPINKHQLDAELEVQSAMLEAVGRRVAQLNADLERAKRQLQVGKDSALAAIANLHPELTNPQKELKVAKHERYADAFDAMVRVKQELEEWEAVQKAWFARGFDLRALADLFGAQYFSQTQVSMQGNTEARYDALRQRIGETRAAATRGRVRVNG